MITAYGDADTKRKALENGAAALLSKLIDFSLLRAEIDTRKPYAVWYCQPGAPVGAASYPWR